MQKNILPIFAQRNCGLNRNTVTCRSQKSPDGRDLFASSSACCVLYETRVNKLVYIVHRACSSVLNSVSFLVIIAHVWSVSNGLREPGGLEDWLSTTFQLIHLDSRHWYSGSTIKQERGKWKYKL
jgi:hypothetical protein